MILKNGKRIDGCTDTLPVGTVQPFLGLTPPLGYLVCQGQMVSKAEYPELYKVCLSAFGIETNTHFYLPDLRGKTLAGYDENDAAMNTIGKLIGQKIHTHTTGDHTLTVAEMPTHQHRTEFSWDTSASGSGDWGYVVKMNRDGQTDGSSEERVGGSQPHNHGSTGEASNYQPTITVNWIVKAAMLIPEYFKVENTLTSLSTSNALSAAQGKLLNDKIDKFLPYPGSRLAWSWGTTIPQNGYTQLIEWMTRGGGGSMGFAEKNGQLSVQVDGLFYQDEGLYRVLDTRDLAASYAFYKWPNKVSISTSGTTVVSKELTITTKKGNPVFLIVTGDNNPMMEGAKNWFNINFYRNGTLLCHQIVESHELSHNIPFAMQYLDAVSTGTYTYKVEFQIGAGSADLGENGWQQTPNFTVFEI